MSDKLMTLKMIADSDTGDIIFIIEGEQDKLLDCGVYPTVKEVVTALYNQCEKENF